MKKIPEALYPCFFCHEDYSWPASDLFWCEGAEDWVCEKCWEGNEIKYPLGISLADEIFKRECENEDR